MSDLIQQLKALKTDPRAGAVSRADHDAAKAKVLFAIGGEAPMSAPATSAPATPVYYRWYLRNLISRPVAIGVSGFVLLTSGWLTTVSAAADSLPGDPLYAIKLVTERAQLQLASLDRKAILHTEFAERRLNEVSALQHNDAADVDGELVRGAVSAYKQELASANENLVELQGSSEASTLETAGTVQANISALEVAVDSVVSESVSPADVLGVQETTRQAGNAAVDVAVQAAEEAHGEDTDASAEQSRQELEEMFHRKLGSLHTRQAIDAHRVEVIRAALHDHADILASLELPTSEAITRFARGVDRVADDVPSAMDSFAAGDFRSAFTALQAADDTLLVIEDQLAEIEITITSALSAPSSPSTP